MKNLCKFSFIAIVIFGLNGCGEEEKEVKKDGFKSSFSKKNMPKKFSINIENIKGSNITYWLENSSKIEIFSRVLEEQEKEAVECIQYSDEETLATYDCTISSSKSSKNKTESIILMKELKYNFYASFGNKADNKKFDLGEIFLPKKKEE